MTKLIEECSATKVARTAMHPDKILDWLVENRILSIALEGEMLDLYFIAELRNLFKEFN